MRKRNNRRAVKPFKKKVEIRSSKKWGNNVDEAVEAALADLGVETTIANAWQIRTRQAS